VRFFNALIRIEGMSIVRLNVTLDTLEVILETVGWLRYQPGL